MSAIFGAARQSGVIVEDLDSAIDHWVKTVGAGPFFVMPHVELEYVKYQGRQTQPDLSIAVGNVGDLQIELIQQHNDEPSPWLNYRKNKGAGVHHISAWSRTYDADLARISQLGIEPDCEGKIAGSCRFAYFNSDAVDGSAYEISDLGVNNETGVLHDIVRAASIAWDGSDPVRSFG